MLTFASIVVLLVSQVFAATTADPVAATYTLKPASIASFTLPSTAIPSATAAQKWIETNWGHVTGKSDYIAFVKDPYDTANKERVLRVEYPVGSYAGSDVGEGGVGMYLNPFGSGVKRAMFTYEVGLEDLCSWRD